MNYPNIAKVAVDIAAATGILNRTTTTAERIVTLAMEALQADGVATEDVRALEAWLGTLTEKQLETLVDGEESEMAALVAESPTSMGTRMCVGQLVEDVYNWLVEKA